MKFEIGEIAIIAHSDNGAGIGSECEILSESFISAIDGEVDYEVRFDFGATAHWSEKNLRKKKPPEIDWVEKLGLVKKEPEGVIA